MVQTVSYCLFYLPDLVQKMFRFKVMMCHIIAMLWIDELTFIL